MSVVPFRRPGSPSTQRLTPRKAAPRPMAPQPVATDCDMMQDGDHDPSEFGTIGQIAFFLVTCIGGFCLGIGLLVWTLWP